MAIDSLRKRASIASLGLAFLGPSVVPDGTLGVEDRQTVGNSYYGIVSTVSGITLGGTSQIGALSSTGGITLERVLGGTSQLGALSSTGGITLERTLGGTSQLGPITSTGVIQVGEVVVEDQATGGWYSWRDSYERHLEERKKKARKEEKARKKAEEIQSDIDRQLALVERELEETEAREQELKRLTKLADKYQSTLKEISPRIELVTKEAVEAQTYSKMERLERELARMQEEEDFLLLAAEIILNA